MRKFTKWMVCVLTVVFAAAILTACGTPDADKLKAKLEKEGYKVEIMDTNLGDLVGAEKMLSATKVELTNLSNMQILTVVFFKDKESLNAAKDAMKEDIPAEFKEQFVFKTSGLAFIAGTKDAVKLV